MNGFVRVAGSLLAGLVLGLVAGFVLRRLWPWVFAEAALGVAVAATLVYVLRVRGDTSEGRRLAFGAGALTIVGMLVGRWLASPGGEDLVGFVTLLVTTEPIFGTLRIGLVGNVILLVAQAALVVWVARFMAEAMSFSRHRRSA